MDLNQSHVNIMANEVCNIENQVLAQYIKFALGLQLSTLLTDYIQWRINTTNSMAVNFN
jgi:hypothetical protein